MAVLLDRVVAAFEESVSETHSHVRSRAGFTLAAHVHVPNTHEADGKSALELSAHLTSTRC